MRLELIAIGDELLSGYVLNTNMQHIARCLLKEGIAVESGTIIKDRLEDVVKALVAALERSSIVIVTGGLGPTIDDITREAAAHVFNTTIRSFNELKDALEKRYGSINANIENQAMQPESAKIIMNPVGSAPGLIFEKEGKLAIFLPGPPAEMAALFELILPTICKKEENQERLSTKWLYFSNIRESEIDPYLRELKEKNPQLEMGIYPAPALLTVSIRGHDEYEIDRAYSYIKGLFPKKSVDLIDGSLSLTCKKLLTNKGLTLACAESLSGGHLGAFITKTPGASDYFLGSVVAYSNSVKSKILRVPEELILDKGAVSKEVAALMAKNVQKITGASIGISLTGIAGPTGGSADKPVGTYFAAIAHGDEVLTFEGKARGTRDMVIEWVVNDILTSLCLFVSGL